MFGGDEVGSMVVDVGSSFSRIGFAGEDIPKAVFQTQVGEVLAEGGSKQYYIAREKQAHREHMAITSPVVNGLVEDWEALEKIWEYGLKTHLRVKPEEHPLMIAESNYNTADRRDKMMELAFETFDAPAAFLCKNAVLSAFSMGRPTALVVDGGGGSTTAVPVHDGFVLQKGLRRTKIGGDTLDALAEKHIFQAKQREVPARYTVARESRGLGTMVCKKLRLQNTTPSYDLFMRRQIVREVKESICRMSETTFDALRNANIPTEQFELPDGKVIECGADRFTVGESLFRPTDEFRALLGPGGDFPDAQFEGLQSMVASSIDACDVDVRKELYNNIVLTGGCTLLQGTDRRLYTELNKTLSPAFRVKIMTPTTPVERRFGSWLGGSILGSLGSFHQMWFSKAEYQEHGSALLAQKCP